MRSLWTRAHLMRSITFVLAWAHTFPVRCHGALFFTSPSLDEGWKACGAMLAVGVYLLPVSWQARALGRLWAERRWALGLGGWILVVAHGIPAADHVPDFVTCPTWADGWRGCGAALAVVWFAISLPAQARILAALTRGPRRPVSRSMARRGPTCRELERLV